MDSVGHDAATSDSSNVGGADSTTDPQVTISSSDGDACARVGEEASARTNLPGPTRIQVTAASDVSLGARLTVEAVAAPPFPLRGRGRARFAFDAPGSGSGSEPEAGSATEDEETEALSETPPRSRPTSGSSGTRAGRAVAVEYGFRRTRGTRIEPIPWTGRRFGRAVIVVRRLGTPSTRAIMTRYPRASQAEA